MSNKLLKRMPYLTGNPRADIQISPDGIPYNAAIPVQNRKMQIVIPTHLRANSQKTLKSLSPALQQEVLIVTSLESDAKTIRKNYRELFSDRFQQVISIEEFAGPKVLKQIDGIAKKRQWLIENIGSQSIFQLDCDQYFFARCAERYRMVDKGQWKLKEKYRGSEKIKLLGKLNLTEEMLTDTFREFRRRMTDKKSPDYYVHTCLSSRMGNNQEESSWKITGRAMHSIGHRRDVLIENNVRFDEIRLREDFNVTLRLLQLGYPNAIYYDVCCSPSDYGAAGGCSTERTTKLSNDQAVLLSKMHPGLVKVVEKNYDSTPRKEVVVSWKKALREDKAPKRKGLF